MKTKRPWDKKAYMDRKEIPACPRCNSLNLEFKKNGQGCFVWCPECRRKNRSYKPNLKH